MNRRRVTLAVAGVLLAMVLFIVRTGAPGPTVTIEIPRGASSQAVAEILADADVIGNETLFRAYVRLRGADRDLKAGRYAMATESPMRTVLEQLTRGAVETHPITIPEGYQLAQMAPLFAELTGESPEAVLTVLRDSSLVTQHQLPGPTLEGYLFPETYRFAEGVPLERIIETLIERYRAVWTPERRAQLAESGMTETEIVALASIIQAEARQVTEMPRISGVYHNRIRQGWPLQADPTVIYALGGYRARLLFAAIDSVADNPYNTYTQPGLPPGPIGSPGEAAIDAALSPERHGYWYFVAQPDGYHTFSETLAQHNAAARRARAALDAAR